MSTRKFTVPAALAAITMFAAPALAAQHSTSSSTLPAGLRPALYQALAKNAGPAYAIGKDGCATLPKQSLTACFTKDGTRFSGKNAPALALRLASFGRGDQLTSVKPVAPTIRANRAAYEHGNVTEWWRVLPMGFEQGFTVQKRPAGNGELTLALVANSNASAHGKDLAWGKLSYGKLVVTDAKGHVVPAALKNQGDRILIAVNDSHAVYPLTVDPLVWLEQKVFSSNGESGDLYGISVALDGQTALIGSLASVNGSGRQGAVYAFKESNGVWTQTQRLTASDGTANDYFGDSVVLSGTTALVGAPCAPAQDGPPITCGPGIVYVFNDSGGVWTQTQEFTSSDSRTYQFGSSLGLTGTTALIGAPYTFVGGHGEQGAVYVFTDSNGTWTQSQRLTANDGAGHDLFGSSIAVSGSTALIGANQADVNGNKNQGAAYVFSESDGAWSQAQKLTAGDGSASDYFGWSVAVSDSTALIGAPYADLNGNKDQGAAYLFTESDGTWSQAQKLTAGDGSAFDGFGRTIALSGPTAFIGAVGAVNVNGAVYEFTESNGAWTQTQKFLPSDYWTFNILSFGNAIAFSGATALVGAYATAIIVGIYTHDAQGAAYFYGKSDLGLALSAPQTVGQNQPYVSQTIATNDASAASPAVSVTVAVPAAVSFVSAGASQGSCSEASSVVTCDFGQINGNAGTATANVTLRATGSTGSTIENTASVAKATPEIMASAPTSISNCADGYTEYDGTLGAGAHTIEPNGQPYQAPAGEENGILTAPAGFRLYTVYRDVTGGRHIIPAPGNELHKYLPAGTFAWIVKAGSAGGAFTFCLNHP
ncbi:MAG: hypothetical protein ACRES7_12205 [Gammaproteobacteria bacterium]